MLYTEHEPLTGLVESYQDAGSVCILRRAESANTDPAERDRHDRLIRPDFVNSIFPPVISQVRGSGTGNCISREPFSGRDQPMLPFHGSGTGNRNLLLHSQMEEP